MTAGEPVRSRTIAPTAGIATAIIADASERMPRVRESGFIQATLSNNPSAPAG